MQDILNYLNNAYATPDAAVETTPKGGDGAIGKIREALRTRPSLLTVLVMLSALAAVSGCGGGEEDDGDGREVTRRIVAYGTGEEPISFTFEPGGCEVVAQNNDDIARVLDSIVECAEGERIEISAENAFCAEVEDLDGNPRIAATDTNEIDDAGETEARTAKTSKACVRDGGGEIGVVVNF